MNGKPQSNNCSPRRGFTLMELLVVIIIMVILTSAMIPILSSASDSRRLREGARLVSTMLSTAQTRAISSGRSVGVLFQPMKNNPYASMELYLVEVPPPYAGDEVNDSAAISFPAGWNPITNPSFSVKLQGPPPTLSPPTYSGLQVYDQQTKTSQKLIRNGDLIRFNYRGDLFVLTDSSATTTPPDYYITSNALQATPLYPNSVFPQKATAVPFQIFRQPVKTVDPPVQLSDGAAVDWYFSGIDLVPLQPPTGANAPTADTYPSNPSAAMRTMFGALGTINNKSATVPGPAGLPSPAGLPPNANTCGPVIITYSAAGTIEYVYYSCSYKWYAAATPPFTPFNYQVCPLSGAYLLIGKIDKIQPASGPVQNDPYHLPNYQDPECRWVSITRQSGLVTTTDVAPLQPAFVNSLPGVPPAYTTSGQYPHTIPEWAGVINAVVNSRRYASGNQVSSGN
jgi:prepilin-type N-terminal cleavage/methylation domain-containing protein